MYTKYLKITIKLDFVEINVKWAIHISCIEY